MRVTKKLLPTPALVAAVVATAALALAGCAPQSAAPSGGGTADAGPAEITVGVITSETGPLAGYGKQYLDGFRAGLDYATDGTNEVDGTKITVEYRDDAGDPDTAVGAAKELIGAGVNILAGSASSGVAAAMAEQAGQNKVLFISGPAAADALTGINGYTFRSGRQSAQDVATAGTFLGDLEGKTVTVFAQNNAFGQGNEAAVKAILGAKGATVNSVLVAEDVTEFTPFAQQVLAGTPDLVFVAWAGATSGAMWQAMSQQGVLDATIPPDLAARWAAAGVPLTQGYGLTEAAPNVLCLPASESTRHPGAVGRPYPHVDVCVADPDTGLVLDGEATGELWVRGPSVFAGYLHDAAASARVRQGEWLRTGDIVHRDGEGVYRIVDRLKDIFISGGENVAPAEVERALELHPAVAQAAVVGVPDDVWGERGVAFVVRVEGALLGEDEVLAHARAELAGFKVPVRVVFVDDLPRSTIEKLARSRLRERAARLVEGTAHEHS
ncbi:ABC transporter substrate-binding protein [Microbacterium aurum]